MAVSTRQTTDVTEVLMDLLAAVPNLRTYAFVADNFRPPGVVIAQPSIDFADLDGGFCSAVWTFGLTVVTTRSSDREAQRDMSQLVLDVASALDVQSVPGALSVEPLTATPTSVSVSGTELPAYTLTVRVRT